MSRYKFEFSNSKYEHYDNLSEDGKYLYDDNIVAVGQYSYDDGVKKTVLFCCDTMTLEELFRLEKELAKYCYIAYYKDIGDFLE